jgi:hypothetical protein
MRGGDGIPTTALSPASLGGRNADDTLVTKVNSHVLAASIPGVNVRDLQDPVLMTFVHQEEAVSDK